MVPWWLGVVGVLGLLLFLLAGLSWWGPRRGLAPETTRKTIHVTMGLVALSFPWVFGTNRTAVLVLAVCALVAMIGLRVVRPLRLGIGASLHGVTRTSFGEMFFIISLATVYWLTSGQSVLYTIPVLVLALADAAGALIGLRYATGSLAVAHEDKKSLEGSVSFFTVAFFSTLAPLLLFSAAGRAETLLLALLIGALVALIEAVSIYESDNLLIPLATYAFLSTHLALPAATLAWQAGVLLALAVVARYWLAKGTTSVTRLGVVASVLAGYLFVTLGGWRWLVAPATLFFAYSLLPPLTARERAEPPIDTRIVATNMTVGLFWLFVTRSWHLPGALYPFTVAMACHLAMNIATRLRRYFDQSPGRAVLIGWLEGGVLILVPGSLLLPGTVWPGRWWAVAGVLVAALLVPLLEDRMGGAPADPRRGWVQAIVALAVSSATTAACHALDWYV